VRRAVSAGVILVALVVTSAGCRRSDAAVTSDAGIPQATKTAAVPPAMGCASNAACAADEQCVFTPQLCGKGSRPGACQKKPAGCHGPRAPVCGCDGKIYDTECEARAAGIDLDVTGACRETVPDWIRCGAHLCDARASYCEIVLSDVFELPTDSVCKPLPASCLPHGDTARGCDCFPQGTRCLSFCGHIETGKLPGFHLTCRL
jgi:hypothetical protein